MPRVLLSLLLLATGPSPTPAQEAPDREAPAPAAPAVQLEIQVLDPDGQPIEGAEVGTQALGTGQTFGGVRVVKTTDERGRLELDAVEPGEVRISVRAAGYTSVDRVLELEAGASRRERFVLEPVPSAPVEVRVVDDEGAPVAEAPISLRSVRDPGAAEEEVPLTYLSERTDGEGRVRWEQIPFGSYHLTVQPPSGSVSSVFERSEPERVEVPPSGLEHRVVLRRPPGRAVSGRVVDADGTGVAGVTVTLFAGGHLETVTGPGGELRFDHVPYGAHRLQLRVPGEAERPWTSVRVAEEPEPWLLRLEPAVEVFGELRLPRGVEVGDRPDDRLGGEGGWRVSARRPESGISAVGWMEGPTSFRFPPLAPGVWQLTATWGRLEGTARVELGGGRSADPVRRDIAIEPPPEGHPVTGVLSHRGRPLAGARLRLGSMANHLDYHVTETGEDGSFAFEEVSSGAYHLTVSWQGTVSRQQSLVFNRIVEVDGATDLSRELRFAWVRGRVELQGVDPTTVGVRLQPRGPGGDPSKWLYMTHSYQEYVHPGPDGAFEVGPLEEGRWDFHLDVPGYVPLVRRVVIDGEDVDDLVLAPEPSEGLVLRLVTSTGEPPESLVLRYRPAGVPSGDTGRDLVQIFSPTDLELPWRGVPSGPGRVWVETRYSKAGPFEVQVPGPALTVPIPPRGKLLVQAPTLSEAERRGAVVRVRSVDAPRPAVREITDRESTDREITDRELTLDRLGRALVTLSPGTYEVTVETVDGRGWSEVVEVRDQARVDLVVE